jgi:hypothetical protein
MDARHTCGHIRGRQSGRLDDDDQTVILEQDRDRAGTRDGVRGD